MASLDSAIDRLYQLPLDRFTAERNALAAELKQAGDKAAAAQVKALAKPSATAWALNQAFWSDRQAFKAMLDAGEALRSAHRDIQRGRSADLRGAVEVRQRAVDRVIEAAVEALGGSGQVSASVRHRLAGTAEALASSGAPADTGLGRLSADLQSTGLDVLSALAGSVAPSAPQPVKPPRPVIVSRKSQKEVDAAAKAKAREAEAARLDELRADLASRKAALQEAAAEAASTARAEKKARAALESASARVAELEQALDAAREDERERRRAAAQATKAAADAEMVRARTVRDVDLARSRVDEQSGRRE